jgi:hypothetical protein
MNGWMDGSLPWIYLYMYVSTVMSIIGICLVSFAFFLVHMMGFKPHSTKSYFISLLSNYLFNFLKVEV